SGPIVGRAWHTSVQAAAWQLWNTTPTPGSGRLAKVLTPEPAWAARTGRPRVSSSTIHHPSDVMGLGPRPRMPPSLGRRPGEPRRRPPRPGTLAPVEPILRRARFQETHDVQLHQH